MFRSLVLRNANRGIFKNVQMGPPDPILGLTVAYNNDSYENKVNLGTGSYRDNEGKPFVLPCVREAETKICGNMNHEYAPIGGDATFCKAAATLLFGENCSAAKEGRLASFQTISGTGGLSVGAHFLNRFAYEDGRAREIYVPNPTWGNHGPIFKDANIKASTYTYYNPATCGLNLEQMLNDLRAMPKGSIVLLHACAHNPTGVDPLPDQWKQISDVCKEMEHYPFFDSAYQGFASGCPETDAFAVRYFIEQGHNMIVTQSFAKNMGLYGNRVGALHIICDSAEEKAKIESQAKIIIRAMYSNPPIHGARLVTEILSSEELTAQWRKDVKVMADRIISMRKALTEELKALGSTKNWDHIENQIGMFCFTGLTPEQVKIVVEEHHVYMTSNGRISVAGVTPANVKLVARAMHEVTK